MRIIADKRCTYLSMYTSWYPHHIPLSTWNLTWILLVLLLDTYSSKTHIFRSTLDGLWPILKSLFTEMIYVRQPRIRRFCRVRGCSWAWSLRENPDSHGPHFVPSFRLMTWLCLEMRILQFLAIWCGKWWSIPIDLSIWVRHFQTKPSESGDGSQ